MKKFLLSLVVLLVFASCASIPEPVDDKAALLCVPIEFDQTYPGNAFGYCRISIIDADTKEEVTKGPMYVSSDYVLLKGLEAGDYVAQTQFHFNDSDETGKVRVYSFPVQLKAGKLSILQKTYQYGFDKRDDGNYWMTMDFRNRTDEEAAKIEAKLMTQKGVENWEITVMQDS